MYTKSILRSLILDGGVSITDPIRLRDPLRRLLSIRHTVVIFRSK